MVNDPEERMSHTHTMTGTAAVSGLRRRLAVALVASVPVTAALELVNYYGGVAGAGDDTPLRAAAVATTVCAVAALVVWLSTRGACEQADLGRLPRRTLVVLGALALISVPMAWIGLTAPLGASALVFGRAAAGGGRAGAATAALGAFALVAGAILCIVGS
jgi:hypothetical protein